MDVDMDAIFLKVAWQEKYNAKQAVIQEQPTDAMDEESCDG